MIIITGILLEDVFSDTVIVHDAVFPLDVVAVIIAVPLTLAVIMPLDTVTILESLVFQIIFLLVALLGLIVA